MSDQAMAAGPAQGKGGQHPADEPHEQRDVHRGAMLLFAAGFAVTIALIIGALFLIFGQNGEFASAKVLPDAIGTGELGQRYQWQQFKASEEADLTREGWTSWSHQTARLPIDDAMALLARKGAAR